jgi:uncharacterized RDD family membrane protein YckC
MDDRQEGRVVEYAGFWMRLGAYLIDGIAVWIISWFLLAVIGLITFPFAIERELVSFHPLWFFYRGLWSFIWIIIPAAYFILLWVLHGQTPGMMALRIKLIRTDGSPVDWGAAIVRFLGYIICWITLGLLFLWIAFDGRKQGLHDKMADTCMIILPRKRVILPETS